MSFLLLGGDGSSRPTFFEVVAAERLMPSLKAAVVYSLSVFAQRRPFAHRLLQWEDEIFALITTLLDRQSLSNHSASFADSLYGLRRAPFDSEDEAAGAKRLLPRKQQDQTLLLLVALPYIKSKLDALYNRHRRVVDAPLGLRFMERRASSIGGRQDVQPSQQESLPLRTRRWALAAFIRVYPWVHASQEALQFTYQLLYLLDSTPFFSPALHLLRQTVVRVSGNEMVEVERATRRRRQRQLARVAATSQTFLGRLLRTAWLRTGYIFADHTRNALILAVFAFKLLEWWYTSGEEKLAQQKNLPPPPPPPPPLPDTAGLPLPEDVAECPICRRTRTNPAMAAPSGYVFCYPCIFNFVTQNGCCPVTRIPATVDDLRRLYQSA